MPYEPDTVPHYRSRIHGHILSERKNISYIFALAVFSGENANPATPTGENGSEEKQRGITIKISEPEQEKPFVGTLPEKSQPRIRNHASPPESPGQEKSIPYEPDIVRHYRSRIHAHVLSERKKHLLHIIRSCFLLWNVWQSREKLYGKEVIYY